MAIVLNIWTLTFHSNSFWFLGPVFYEWSQFSEHFVNNTNSLEVRFPIALSWILHLFLAISQIFSMLCLASGLLNIIEKVNSEPRFQPSQFLSEFEVGKQKPMHQGLQELPLLEANIFLAQKQLRCSKTIRKLCS